MERTKLIIGDITRVPTDAIVNAANEGLVGGLGVDGAIHHAAGADLRTACLALPEVLPGVRCPVGQCRVTLGYQLAAKYVLHTVGPVWVNGERREADLLCSCYRSCLETARALGCRTVAFPAIACGAHGYPLDAAARIARRAIREFLRTDESLREVVLVAFDAPTYAALASAVSAIA